MKQKLNRISATCQKHLRVRIRCWVEVKVRVRMRARVRGRGWVGMRAILDRINGRENVDRDGGVERG